MAWNDFDIVSGLERDVLRRSLPSVPSSGQTYARATLAAGQPVRADVGVNETLGATPEGCVELLALRPLLVGAAWKVLDLLLEEALDQAGVTPDQKRGFSIKFKQGHAQRANARPAQLAASVWPSLMGAYDATVQIRHALVHRRAHTDAVGALIGVNDAGQPLRPMQRTEQVAFARAAPGAADQVLMASADRRSEARLLRHLTDLAGLHGHQVAASADIPGVVPELTVIVEPDPADPGRFLLELGWNFH